ncbi:MAG: prepilin-type N-terminal cleavage/methylation domain-containing protein [Pseudomonadota bacterium]
MQGFTLLELLLVLGIIAMTAALTIPRLQPSSVALLKAEARTLTAMLNNARRMAMIHGTSYKITMHPLPEDVPPSEFEPIKNTKHDWYSRGATLKCDYAGSDDTLENEKCEINFYPEGSADGIEIMLVRDEREKLITVSALNGRVQNVVIEE